MSFTKGPGFQLCVQMNERFMESSEVNHDPALTLTGVILSIQGVLVSGQYTGIHICRTYLKIPHWRGRGVELRENWNSAEKQQGSGFCPSSSTSHHQAAPQHPGGVSPCPSHLTQLDSHHPFSQINFCFPLKLVPESPSALWNHTALLEDGQISISMMSPKPEKPKKKKIFVLLHYLISISKSNLSHKFA